MIVVATLVLGAVFLVAGVLKIGAPQQWRAQSRDLGVPRAIATPLPFCELAIGALLVSQIARRVVALVAAALLLAFTIMLVVRIRQGRRAPCACFGAWSTKPVGWIDVTRNIAIIVVAAVVAASSR